MKSFFIKSVVIALALVGMTSAKAQTTMSLHDCMAYAVSNSTKMRIQQAVAGDAQIARRDAALKLFTPQINASTYAYYNFGRSIDPQTLFCLYLTVNKTDLSQRVRKNSQ